MFSRAVFFFLLVWVGISSESNAQRVHSVTASNGFMFEVGDTVMLGVGSSPDGGFNHIYSVIANTILASIVDEDQSDFRLPEFFHGAPVEIKKIKINDSDTLLVFDTEDWGAYIINLEKAISTCEIALCRQDGFMPQEFFEKLILLYRAASNQEITNERFLELRREMLGDDLR